MARRPRSERRLYPSEERTELRKVFTRIATTPNGLEQYMRHIGVKAETVEAACGDPFHALLAHYQNPDGRRYNMSAVANDLASWQPVMAAINSIGSYLAHKVSK